MRSESTWISAAFIELRGACSKDGRSDQAKASGGIRAKSTPRTQRIGGQNRTGMKKSESVGRKICGRNGERSAAPDEPAGPELVGPGADELEETSQSRC